MEYRGLRFYCYGLVVFNGTLKRYRSRKLIELEKDLQTELEGVLDNEELFWKLKSHSDWLLLGDRNTKYFHCQANKKKMINHIKSLKLDVGLWCYEEDRLKYEVVSFYRRLYTDDATNVGLFLVRNVFSIVEPKLFKALD
ncbi:putative Transposon TX1 [Gossypium australe]|uniref:Putative Transposon TX1 n=1 Tax=Gossypium australe TaxID=47621 RepID=A0A5B6VQA2_9ROSI|nr:putative Transposon TX1 [Gossypium australe]